MVISSKGIINEGKHPHSTGSQGWHMNEYTRDVFEREKDVKSYP
jgi:hypothetical protein